MRVIFFLGAFLLLPPILPAQTREGKEASDALLARAKQLLARVDGEYSLVGLTEAVEVRRDRWGIAHIYAQNAADLFFAQGFVAAQDRLFQLDLWRRQAAGEMAEILGKEAVDADCFARLIKYRGSMEEEWVSYSPDTKAIATAFTQGINACIEQFGDQFPIEFQILGIRPKKWQPEDILGRMSGIYMSQNFRNEIQRAQLVAAVGFEKARCLAPVDPPRDYTSALSLDELHAIDKRLLAGYDAAVKVLSFKPAKTESNNWVVAGPRSASGKPLLASDPHRAIALPSLRYLVHLNAPGWNVIGSGEPALPGVALGHNERIAWGFTIVGTDQADFFVEETNSKNPDEYKVGDRWEKMTVLREPITVRGEPGPRTVEVRFTRHGPVLFQNPQRHRAYALKWVGSEPGGAAYLRSLAIARARNRQEFVEALSAWKVPGLNFVYADVEGTIGWIAAAQTPFRPRHDGLLPVPGNGGFEWTGYLGVHELPQSFNPKAGFVATANHNILPEGYQRQIGYEFAPPYRFQRIQQRLTSREQWQLSDFQSLQQDVKSLPGLALARLLRDVDLRDPSLEPFAKIIREWDGQLTVDAQAGPLYAIWLRTLQEKFYAPHVPKELQSTLAALSGLPVMLKALEKADPLWFGSDAKASRDRLLRSTFAEALGKVKALHEPQRRRWGVLHRVTFQHPLAALGLTAAQAFNLGPVERPGDVYTPNNTRYDESYQQIHGATYRHLFDLADWNRALATSAPGQSGQPGSPHYGDLLPGWARGEYFPLAYSRKKVEEVTQHQLWLKPR
jgi:penicillin amidase